MQHSLEYSNMQSMKRPIKVVGFESRIHTSFKQMSCHSYSMQSVAMSLLLDLAQLLGAAVDYML